MALGDRIGLGYKFYTPLSKEITYSAASGASVYSTQLSITGSGYLNKCVFMSQTGSYTMTLRVTIDGIMWYLGTNITSTLSGITNENLIYGATLVRYGGGSGVSPVPTTGELPYTGNAAVIAYIDSPLQFKQSLLVEAMGSSTALTAGRISILGGIG